MFMCWTILFHDSGSFRKHFYYHRHLLTRAHQPEKTLNFITPPSDLSIPGPHPIHICDPAMRPPLSKSGQCCPLVLVTTEVHIVWRSHAPHWPGAGARNTVYTTPGVASSSGAGAAQLCVDPRTDNMWPGERRQREDDQPVKTSQMVKQWLNITSALNKKDKASNLQWNFFSCSVVNLQKKFFSS